MERNQDRSIPPDGDEQGVSGGAPGLSSADLIGVFLELRPKIERVVTRRVGNPAVAADLVQDMYLRLSRISERLASGDEARNYLLKMAVNASIDHLRIEGRRAELLAGAIDLFDQPERTPEETALAEDQLRGVDAALSELPSRCREILFLSRVEGLTHTEIAQQLGVSRSLVEKYVVKALLHCRARLSAMP
ncbi:MAG: RNA polymerase sigma factor [Panacagrimonas sp.]